MSKKIEEKKKKTFITTIVIETDYDPKDLGLAQIVLDVSLGGASCKTRTTKQV